MPRRTISDVKAVIEARRASFAAAPFMRWLETASTATDLRAFVPHLSFYVFAFQDMLRLAAQSVVDPALGQVAHRHRDEDAGHEQWFASDLSELGCSRDLAWVFGEHHAVTRDVSYALMAEILNATDDRVRIAFPLVLEAMGSVFFPRVVGVVERAGFHGRLKYFARSHEQVEAAHDIFTAQGEKTLEDIVFDEPVYDAVIAMVHRCFDQGERIAAFLDLQRSMPASG